MRKTPLRHGLECTGCGACAARCPKQAVEMATDGEGFIKTRIDPARCVDCGICERVCPVNNPRYDNDEPVCHAMAARDDVRMGSSSGGIFPLLAEDVIEDGASSLARHGRMTSRCVPSKRRPSRSLSLSLDRSTRNAIRQARSPRLPHA